MKKVKYIRFVIISLSISSLLFSCSKEEGNPTPDPYVEDFVNGINADSLQKKVQWLQDMGTRFTLNDNRKEVANKIKDRFISYGYTNTTLDSFFLQRTYSGITYYTWQYNVIAKINGAVDPDNVCILGGHYDDYSKNSDPFITAYGANDNASGTAATLEVARVLKSKNFSPKTTIEFICFAAEELGLYGSSDYSLKSYTSSKKIRFMLNNDMIAFWPSDQSNMKVNIIDYSNSHDLRESAETACQLYTSLGTNNDSTYYKSSDSYPFYQRGFKAIFFISDADDPNYHTTSDLVSNCNFTFCKEVTKVSCALLVAKNK